jgi:hypothetical protein
MLASKPAREGVYEEVTKEKMENFKLQMESKGSVFCVYKHFLVLK